MIRPARNFILLHLAANALLLWLAYQWLGVDETSGAKLAWSAIAALAIVALFCWLYGATLVYFSQPARPRINYAFRAALRHMGILMLLAVGVMIAYGLVARWTIASDQPPFHVASWLTMKLRKPVKPATIASVYYGGFWILRWVVLPVLLLPLAAGFARKGWHGWREFLRRRSWRDWVFVPVMLLAGLWLPLVLMGWRPGTEAFAMEMLSFAVRGAVAYLLYVGSALALAFHLGHAGLRARD